MLRKNGIWFDPKVKNGHILSHHSAKFELGTGHPSSGTMPLGAFSYSRSRFAPVSRIGHYCSIADKVAVFQDRHPTNWVSTSPAFYADNGFHRGEDYLPPQNLPLFDHRPQPISIGDDVWIGQDVLIRDGIHIGTGAVVAAGSVVTKNVEPYQVVGGNPAKFIRYRIEESLVQIFLEMRWWRYEVSSLRQLNMTDPALIYEEFSAAQKNSKMVVRPEQRASFLDHLHSFPEFCES
jgi:acetyltransferase-like isoleucine patch superfamily enzyme